MLINNHYNVNPRRTIRLSEFMAVGDRMFLGYKILIFAQT